MTQIRAPFFVCTVLVAALSHSLPAQTATPTLTPVPAPTCTPRNPPAACRGAKLQVVWLARDPGNVHISVSATGCPLTQTCLAGVPRGDLVSVPPMTVTVADAGNLVLSKQVSDPGRNVGGCPGGSDTYRGVDRLRLVYGAATTLIAKLSVGLADPTPPTLNPPVTVTVRDACGAVVNATANSCFVNESSVRTTVKCILSPPL